MKNLYYGFTLVCLLFVSTPTHSQDYYLYMNGKKVFYTATDKAMVQSENRSSELDLSKESGNVQKISDGLSVVKFTDKDGFETLTDWRKKDGILFANRVLSDRAGNEFCPTNELFVRLKQNDPSGVLEKIIRDLPVRSMVLSDFDERTYRLTLNAPTDDAMAIANRIAETGLFEYAEPNMMVFIEPTTNDEYFHIQWALQNTGLGQDPGFYGGVAGTDIKAVNAWNLSTGAGVKVAVIDCGVQLNHPDLVNNLLPGYDATLGGSAGANVRNDRIGAHGTCCAGIIAAQANNTIGTAGVAYNSKILPVRVFEDGGGINQNQPTKSENIARGVRWATDNQADVISMSIGNPDLMFSERR